MTTNPHIDQPWWALRLTYGSVAFLAGLDKYFNILANWESYLSPGMVSLLPVSASTGMHAIGLIEMAVGILILTRWTRVGAYTASLWLLAIAFTLLAGGMHIDVAVRDVAMAVGAWTLGRLTEARQPSTYTMPARAARVEA